MVTFSNEEKKLFVYTVIFNISFNSICMLVALHNIFRFVCKAGNSKLLINIFYTFIVTALAAKIFNDADLFVQREKVYRDNGIDIEDRLLLLISLFEDGLYIIYILMTQHLTLAIMFVFGQIDERQIIIYKRIAYALAFILMAGSVAIALIDFEHRIWYGVGMFLITELTFLIVISVLHFKLRKLHKSAFKNERRSIKLQNIVFLIGSIMRDVFLFLVYKNFKYDSANLFCLLLFLSCIKLSLPILLYMIVHCYTFTKADKTKQKLEEKKASQLANQSYSTVDQNNSLQNIDARKS